MTIHVNVGEAKRRLMLITHAFADDFTVVTGDEKMRSYPVNTLW